MYGGKELSPVVLATVVVAGCARPGDPHPANDAAGGPVATTPGSAPPTPVVQVRTITETVTIAYPTSTVEDSSLPAGTTKPRTQGVPGSRTITYEVTYTDGVETARRTVSDVVTQQPVTEVTAVGTRTAAAKRCDPNYTPGVPIASDVDCAGGGGNGPAYARGPVRVIGTDIYDLDRDGDGVGCQN